MADSIEQVLGIEPGPHFEQALTHPSYRNERPGAPDNQRLEFLGDAVLEFCASEALFLRFPGADEGELTRMRAKLVNADALADWARRHNLAESLRLGRGASAAGLAESRNVLADAVEALLAAAYLDAGIDVARAACLAVIGESLSGLDEADARDPKSELQERVQARGAGAPRYRVTDGGGPAHDPWFVVSVEVDGKALATGKGKSKREAEREAANTALRSGAWHGGDDDR